jgi:predicted RNA-binding Zn-ribbon protein involved in translation (DUF1610 family)
VSKVKVSIEGHYEMREMSYGKDYVWQTSHAIIACDCGQVMDVDEHHTTCPNCGTDHSDLMRQVAGRHLSDDVLHPWHRDYEEWKRFKERRTEYQEWLEQRALDLDNDAKDTT